MRFGRDPTFRLAVRTDFTNLKAVGHPGYRVSQPRIIACRNLSISNERPESIIRWHYLWYVAAGLAMMVAAIVNQNVWLLNYVHVFSSLLWTGIDLFMGFVLGPILRRADISVRREVMRQLTPRTLFLMPTVSIVAGTTGWFLAVQLGYTALAWPEYGWVAAALLLVALMTVLGLGFLTPVNVLVCLELQKANADLTT